MPIGVARRKATQFSYSVSVAAKAAGYGADKGRDPRLLKKAVAWTLDGDFGQHSADGRATRPHAPLKEPAARSCSAEGESCTAPPAG